MINIPKNISLETQYTSGNEFVIQGTTTPYTGYYFVINDKIYTGKKPDNNSISLEKSQTNQLNNIKRFTFHPSKFTKQSSNQVIRYFTKKLKENPIKILEINLETYNTLKNDPSYQIISLEWNLVGDNTKIIDQTEKIFIGIKPFLSNFS